VSTLSWAGTPTQRDTAKLAPELSPEDFADAYIANIRDGSIASTDHGNVQTVALLWRLFTTPIRA
jgi:hypothetical protein